MAITTLDQLVAGLQAANAAPVTIYKYFSALKGNGFLASSFFMPGMPGAAAAPTPGLAGAALTTYSGQIPFTNPASGNAYLGAWMANSANCGPHMLCDRLWHNSGITSTQTTAHTINSVAFPARDSAGAVDGADVMIAIEVSTATSNGGAITNTTIGYTNSANQNGRTGTIQSFPSNAPAGTFVPFTLQAGDVGVKSVESLTLGTSYGTGVIHLVAFRQLAALVNVTNGGQSSDFAALGMPRMFDNSVPFIVSNGSATVPAVLWSKIAYAHG